MGSATNIPSADASKESEALDTRVERDLVALARAGDRGAFKTLAERYYRRIYKMLLVMTRSEDAAMELTQETFFRAIQGIGSFNMSSSFYTWLYRIAANAALDRMRRSRSAGQHEEYNDAVDHGHAFDEPSHAVSKEERRQKVLAAMDELKPEHRQILVLREFEDLSYEEIAAVLDIKMGTVMSRLFAARMRLREILENKYGMR